MFTVLIAEQQHIDAIRQKNSLFFEPFLDNKEVVFCPWNPRGQSLTEAVPDLHDLVGRRRQWRAVVLNPGDEEQLKCRNPFDTVDASSLNTLEKPSPQPADGEDWDLWEQDWKNYYRELTPRKEAVFRSAMEKPLQKLSTWLCFLPTDFVLQDVSEKKNVEDWAMDRLQQEQCKPGTRLEALEREQYRIELRMKEQIRREFVGEKPLDIAYPTEFHCISQRISRNGFFHPDTFWNVRSDLEYSTFADRNMFLDKLRFMVFDVLPSTHKNYRPDRIRFLYAVMVFACNPVPGSAMQARRLYLLDSENDDTPLCTIATSYERKLSQTYDNIEAEIEKIRSEIPGELSDREAEALFCSPADIPVSVDRSIDTEALEIEAPRGLSGDCPTRENQYWSSGYAAAEHALTQVLKQRGRAVRKSVDRVAAQSEVDHRAVSRLNSFQMDDVREYTQQAEDEMVTHLPADFADASLYTQPMEQKSEEVKKVINRRMSKKTTLLLSALVLGLYLLCMLPLLLRNSSTTGTFSTSLLLTLGILLGVALTLLITLFFLRRPLKQAVTVFNEETESILDRIKASMQEFSNYLSALCNARRGHAVLQYSEKHVDMYTRSIRIRKRHQEDIRHKRACLAEDYSDFILDRSYCDKTMSEPYDYDFGQKTEFSYPAPFLAGDSRQVEFLESGNFVTVPSSYVSQITVRMEEIYDK